MSANPDDPHVGDAPDPGRRSFLTSSASLAMGAGLVLGYGSCFGVGLRYLYPAKAVPTRWQFVSEVGRIEDGGQVTVKLPNGGGPWAARSTGSRPSGASSAPAMTAPSRPMGARTAARRRAPSTS